MQVLKIYLFLAALGIPFQPLPDYEEGADQVLFFSMFILAKKF